MKPCFMLIALAALAGCAAGPIVDGDADSLPQPFEIDFRAVGPATRLVYYRLESNGTIGFGGGRNATIRNAPPLGKLPDADLMRLWSIIRKHDLLNASGSGWAKRKTVRYEVEIRAGSHRNSFRSVDDRTPGLDELDAALFDMQSRLNYADVFRAYDERVRKAGGAVKKK